MEILLGMLGALSLLAAFFLGRGTKLPGRPPEAPRLPPEEYRYLKEKQQALERLQNYTVEDAYGMNREVDRH